MTGTPRAKICGLTNEGDLAAAVEAGADAVGFVVDVPIESPRELPVERARELIDRVPPFVTSVVVTMPDSPGKAASLVERVRPDALQVHAAAPEDLAAIGEGVEVPVVAAIDAETDPDPFAEVADALLIDSLDAAGAGGTGETGDWERTREIVASSPVPVILAGGLTPTNVVEAIDVVEPFAVDVASGVETRGGRKDHEAVRTFVERATTTRPEATVRP